MAGVQLHARCYHCKKKCKSPTDVVHHCFADHPGKELAILKPSYVLDTSRIKYLACHYGVTPDNVKTFQFNEDTWQFSYTNKLHEQEFDSPIAKSNRLSSTPCKSKAPRCLVGSPGLDDYSTISSQLQNVSRPCMHTCIICTAQPLK